MTVQEYLGFGVLAFVVIGVLVPISIGAWLMVIRDLWELLAICGLWDLLNKRKGRDE